VPELGQAGIPKPTIDKLAPRNGRCHIQGGIQTRVSRQSPIAARHGLEEDHWYGKTTDGKFMSEAEAKKAGYQEARH
jgi:hypothetical protein